MNKYKYETGGEFKEDTPKIYVADLKSYNEGRLVGQWVDLTDYDSGEEVSEKIASLMKEYSKKYHNGEETEHSIHDYENFDSSLYSEYMGEKDYDIIIDTHKISKEKGIPAEVLQSIANDFSPDDLEEFVDDRYIGEYDGDYELGENYVDNVGGIEGVSNPEFYFDYEALGRDLSINNYNEYDGHYFQNYKKGGTVKEYDLSKYAKGGEAISREKIVEVLKDELEDVLEDANQEYEGQEITGEEVEYKSRDGFIPFTDGGYEYRFFTYGNYLTGSGKSLPTNTLDAELERVENLNYEYGKERFAEEYPEIVKELGEENIDYNSLSEAGYDSEADNLDEFSRSDDDSIMFEVEAFYYNPDNSRGIDGKHTIVLTGNVNMEAPYHRTGNYEDYTQYKFTFDSIEDLKEKLQKGIEKISKWFNGDNYKEGRELKMGRFEKGGSIKDMSFGELYDYLQDKDEGYWDNVNSEEIVRMYIDDMNNDGINVSHIEEAIENNPSREGLYEIWLGNSMNTPTPINTKEDLLEALELDKKDFAKGGSVKKELEGYQGMYDYAIANNFTPSQLADELEFSTGLKDERDKKFYAHLKNLTRMFPDKPLSEFSKGGEVKVGKYYYPNGVLGHTIQNFEKDDDGEVVNFIDHNEGNSEVGMMLDTYKKYFIDQAGFIHESELNENTKGGKTQGNDDVIIIKLQDKKSDFNDLYYIKKIDSTHINMSPNEDELDGYPSHIADHNEENYYDDVRSWLKGGKSPNGKTYKAEFSKGGEVKKKSDNSMLIGGLAGILLGIFLGRK